FIKYGRAASEAMFDFPCQFFRAPECLGIIPYRIESKCAVVIGDPICPPEEIHKLAKAFNEYCNKSNLNIIYIIVSEKFAKWAMSSHCNILIEICQEVIFDPQQDTRHVSKRIKHRVENSIKYGLKIHEYIPKDQSIENILNQIGSEWEKAIKGPNIYIGHLNFFESYLGKRWFYVKDGDEITSMAMLCRVESCDGWLLKFLITKPHVYHDTSEFLFISVLNILKEENCNFLTKGVLPLEHLGELSGLGPISKFLAKKIFKFVFTHYKFKTRNEYWLRHNPKSESAYLLFRNSYIGLNEIRALMKVMRTNQH
nr:DUF2156 domain-containing protein [Parachlamydiaceae bacterium]